MANHTAVQKYPTKPLDSWQKAKDIRTNHLSDLVNAKERGKKVLLVNAENGFSLWSGFPSCQVYWPIGYTQELILRDPDHSREAFEDMEAMGYRDICWWTMAPLGEMSHRRAKVKADIIVTHHVCEPMVKSSQVIATHFGIPTFPVDFPRLPLEQLKPFHFDYLVNQFHEAMEWMEKVTGTKCDDEALCRGVRNEWEVDVLLARILELNKATPAPLDMKMFAALEFPAWPESFKDNTVQYFRALYDEVKYRVANGIAAVATERCRLFHEAAPPFPYLNLLKAGHKYGAVFVGGSGFMIFPPAFVVGEDGSLTAAKTLEEQGIQLRTRDDALRALAKLYLYNSPQCSWMSILPRAKIVSRAVQDWHVDGDVIHIDHGCQGMPAGMSEVQLELKEMGIPTMAYEAHSVDGRGYNESQLLDSFESFFENLGLSVIED